MWTSQISVIDIISLTEVPSNVFINLRSSYKDHHIFTVLRPIYNSYLQKSYDYIDNILIHILDLKKVEFFGSEVAVETTFLNIFLQISLLIDYEKNFQT